MPLVYSADFDNLPAEPALRWLKLRDLVERRLDEVTDTMNGVSDHDLVEYCSVLASAAEELKLGKFNEFSVGDIRQNYENLRADVIALATRLSIRSSSANAAFSVALPRTSKAKIYNQIERLRAQISGSDMGGDQKKKLFLKLDELHQLVVMPRTDFGKAFAVIAYVAMTVGGSAAFLADAPDAIATISAIIGEAKVAEEEEQRLIEEEKPLIGIPDMREDSSDSDEIPF